MGCEFLNASDAEHLLHIYRDHWKIAEEAEVGGAVDAAMEDAASSNSGELNLSVHLEDDNVELTTLDAISGQRGGDSLGKVILREERF